MQKLFVLNGQILSCQTGGWVGGWIELKAVLWMA
jgi:hypothetical protein